MTTRSCKWHGECEFPGHCIDRENAEKVDVRSMPTLYSDDGSTAWVPLPRDLWRRIDCSCIYCRDADGNPTMSYWDTMAVSTMPPRGGKRNLTWLVHMPEAHGKKPLR